MATAVADSYSGASGRTLYVGRQNPYPAWRDNRTALQFFDLPAATQHSLIAGAETATIGNWGGATMAGDKYLYTGGGHGDGSDNGIYCVDLAQNSPSAALLGGQSASGMRVAVTKSAFTGTSVKAHWNDDGRPNAAHIWQGFHYLSNVQRAIRTHYFCDLGITRSTPQTLTPNNEIWMPAFDPIGSLDWDPPSTWPNFPNFNLSASDAEGGMVWNSPTVCDGTNIWVLNADNGDAQRLRKFDPITKTWTSLANYASGGGFGGVLLDELRRKMVYIDEGSSNLTSYDLVTGAAVTSACTGPAAAMFRPANSTYMGACYDSIRDKYYVYAGQTATGKFLYEIDPANNFYTRVISTTGTPFTTVGAGLCNRMKFIAKWDCIVFTPSALAPMWAIALS